MDGSGTYVYQSGKSFVGQYKNNQQYSGTHYLDNGNIDNDIENIVNKPNPAAKPDGTWKGNLAYILSEVPFSFKDNKGEKDPNSPTSIDIYNALVGLPGAEKCDVRSVVGIEEYCSFQIPISIFEVNRDEKKDHESANILYDKILSELRNAIPKDYVEETVTPGKNSMFDKETIFRKVSANGNRNITVTIELGGREVTVEIRYEL